MPTRTEVAALHYPVPQERRHGPDGYRDYASYKDWLRDEFQFRCVFCLARERWSKDGSKTFGVDHFEPKSRARERLCDYDNLVYACNSCNSYKSTKLNIPSPCEEDFSTHVYFDEDGYAHDLTTSGKIIVKCFRLNEIQALEFRRMVIRLIREQKETAQLLGFPDNLPDLAAKNTKTNHRIEGVKNCYYAQRQAGTLPDTY